MLTIILTMNRLAEGWIAAMAAVLWQSALLVMFVAIVAWWLRRSSPVIRYWLWQIVAIKLLLMPFWTFVLPMPSWTQVTPRPQSAALQPAEGFYDSSGRLAANRAFPSSDGSRSEAAASTASWWEPLAAINWQTWLMSAWCLIVLWQIARLAIQRRRLAALLRRGGFAGGELCHLVAELSQQAGLRRSTGGGVGHGRLSAVCLRAVAAAARLARPTFHRADADRAAAGGFARAGASEASRSGLGLAGGDREDRLFLQPVGALGGLSAPLGAGTGLRSVCHGPQRASAGRLRANAGASGWPYVRAGGRASRSHRRRPDRQRSNAETSFAIESIL